MKSRGIPFRREYQFWPGRGWRFDFAFPDVPVAGRLVAVEIEGGSHIRGKHTRPLGFAKDIQKYNTATLNGWTVLRYTTEMVRSGLAETQVAAFLTNGTFCEGAQWAEKK